MSAKVIRLRPRAVLPAYPVPCNGIHLVGKGDGWTLTKHAGGRSVEMRLTRTELETIADMIELVSATEDA